LTITPMLLIADGGMFWPSN